MRRGQSWERSAPSSAQQGGKRPSSRGLLSRLPGLIDNRQLILHASLAKESPVPALISALASKRSQAGSSSSQQICRGRRCGQ